MVPCLFCVKHPHLVAHCDGDIEKCLLQLQRPDIQRRLKVLVFSLPDPRMLAQRRSVMPDE